MSLVRTSITNYTNANPIFFHSTRSYSFTYFTISNAKILFKNSLLLFRYKSTTNDTNTNSSILEKGEDNENNKSSASINTILKNSFVKENDMPWTGEEDIKTTVLRMIVDKYPPLKIKRNSIKEYIDAHNKVRSPPIPVPSNNVALNKKSTTSIISKKEKLEKIREAKQSRIVNARDAATDYSINKKFGAENDENAKKEGGVGGGEQPKVVPKSIAGWNSLVESRIQEAIAAGEFKNLPYRGKPLPTDPNERNPYLDRTEFFMNRLVQRQGSAPAWIEYQKDVDREIYLFRQRMRESWLRYTNINNIDPHSRNISWENRQMSYYEKAINKLNSRLRSYNTIAPYSVRRGYLSVELEFERMYQDAKQDDNYKAKVVNRDGYKNEDVYIFKSSYEESKEDDNVWKNFAKSIKWWIGK